MHTFEVYFRVPGVSGPLGERIMAQSSDAAAGAVRARYPKAMIDRIAMVS